MICTTCYRILSYTISSGASKNRIDVASSLGMCRETIGQWLSKYEAGGLEELLERRNAIYALVHDRWHAKLKVPRKSDIKNADKALKVPENVVLLFLPPYCPELNPIERLWQDIKAKLFSKAYQILKQMQESITQILCDYSKDVIAKSQGSRIL